MSMQYTTGVLFLTTVFSMLPLAIINAITEYNLIYPMTMMIVCLIYFILDTLIPYTEGTLETVCILFLGTVSGVILVMYGISTGVQHSYSLVVPITILGVNIYLLRDSFLYG